MPEKLTLKQYRLIRGYSQEKMAEMLGKHRSTYVTWEENPEKVSIENAKKIAATLGVSISDIFFTN